MDYTEFLGSLAFFSFLGILLSIAGNCYYEARERKHLLPNAAKFWKLFALYTWVVVLACGISSTGWLIFSIIDWIGMLNE